DNAQDISLVSNSAGNLYVAYRDGGSGKAVVSAYSAGSWNTLGGGAMSPGGASLTSMAIGRDDTPYIAFRDATASNMASVYRYVGGVWKLAGTAGVSGIGVQTVTLASDSAGNIYLCYERSDGYVSVQALE